MRPSRVLALSLLSGLLLLQTGCLTRHVRQDVYDQDRIEVFLRTDKRLFSTVEKGYDHPETIAAARVAHILSRIDLRRPVKDGNRREPAIPTAMLYPIAEGISQALAKANPDQEVVVMALRRHKRLGILDETYLTSLIAYVREDQLYLHVARVDDLMKDTYRVGQQLPQPRLTDAPPRFRLYGGVAMTLIDKNAVAVAWRDPIFKRPTRTRILATGEVKRKTILLESPLEDPDDDEDALLLPSGISPAQLRALADLEEQRRDGAITEAEFRMRQREILESLESE